jgi:hypothetical protein
MVSYLPLPRRGALSGKSARACRRWRLSSCVLILACSPQCRARAASARSWDGAGIRTYAVSTRMSCLHHRPKYLCPMTPEERCRISAVYMDGSIRLFFGKAFFWAQPSCAAAQLASEQRPLPPIVALAYDCQFHEPIDDSGQSVWLELRGREWFRPFVVRDHNQRPRRATGSRARDRWLLAIHRRPAPRGGIPSGTKTVPS